MGASGQGKGLKVRGLQQVGSEWVMGLLRVEMGEGLQVRALQPVGTLQWVVVVEWVMAGMR